MEIKYLRVDLSDSVLYIFFMGPDRIPPCPSPVHGREPDRRDFGVLAGRADSSLLSENCCLFSSPPALLTTGQPARVVKD